jgi:hypothetical protein
MSVLGFAASKATCLRFPKRISEFPNLQVEYTSLTPYGPWNSICLPVHPRLYKSAAYIPELRTCLESCIQSFNVRRRWTLPGVLVTLPMAGDDEFPPANVAAWAQVLLQKGWRRVPSQNLVRIWQC